MDTSCFYCKKNEADAEHSYKHKMYYVNRRMNLWVGYHYTEKEIEIPRCSNCHKKHGSLGGIYLGLFIVGFAFWFWIFKKDDSTTSIWTCTFGAFWLTLFTVLLPLHFLDIIFFHKLKGIPHEEDFDDYPPVKQLISEGWVKSKPDPASHPNTGNENRNNI